MSVDILDSWKTCLEMISERGFILDKKYSTLDKTQLNQIVKSDVLHIIANKPNGEILYLEYLLNNKKKSNYVEYLQENYKIDSINNKTQVVFVTKFKPNSTMLRIQSHKDISIQVFWYKELLMNPSKHVLVPKHTKLPEDEHIEILRQYNLVSKSQMPVLLYTDVIARYYNFRHGDIIKIQGSLLNINEKMYRYRCVK